ncbi:MAG: Uma2 family endonuclease [Pseudomonadota bacterium]|nr:Uma2 family endonuclease [Pseudomonadota bacterium]
MQPAEKCTLYDQLQALPETLTGEILNGQLHAQPRTSTQHGHASSVLEDEIFGPFHRGRGGPGGWWVFTEPEIHFVLNVEIAVPDLGGRRRKRMPVPPREHRIQIVPDWVCEILSPSTESKDRRIKMPIYAHYGVSQAWLVDPEARTFEAYALEQGAWREIARFAGEERVSVAPFEAVSIALRELSLPDASGAR